MANDVNQCNFTGRLGKDPESKTLNNGNMIAKFSIACGEQWKDKTTGEKNEKTEWINCVAFGKLAEIITEYVKKGQQIYISGKMQTDKYDKDGQTCYSTKINVSDMKMLGGKPESQQEVKENNPLNGQQNQSRLMAVNKKQVDFDNDIPF